VSASVLFVDDHVVIAQAMADSLKRLGYDPVAYVPADSLDVENVLAHARRLRSDVALVDLNLGAGRSGIPLIGPLVGLGAKVIALSASDEPFAIAQCLECGAAGFVHKAAAFDVLLSAIDRVLAGEELISQGRRQEFLAELRVSRAEGDARLARLGVLTPREQHVLHGLMSGRSAAQIADESYVSVKTVRTHIESIHRKLGVRSQLAAVAFAPEVGWRPEGEDAR
jgi:DNA-binding NarL/FixJ family response regulator